MWRRCEECARDVRSVEEMGGVWRRCGMCRDVHREGGCVQGTESGASEPQTLCYSLGLLYAHVYECNIHRCTSGN